MLKVPIFPNSQAIVDDEDAWVLDKKWSLTNGKHSCYAKTAVMNAEGKITTGLMSRMILGVTDPNLFVDHINGDTLDNRRANLRAVDRFTNARNRSGAQRSNKSSPYLGVTWNERDQKYQARIFHKGTFKSLGYFSCPEEANAARLRADRELWGIQPRRRHLHKDAR